MRQRKHHSETRVWHNPLMNNGRAANMYADDTSERPANDDAKRPSRRERARIVSKPNTTVDPEELERKRLLARLLAAEGRPAITAAEGCYRENAFEWPNEQNVWLQLLEHSDESIVASAIAKLSTLFAEEEPQRHAMLDSRLRRIAEYADEPATQQAASALRHQISGRQISGADPLSHAAPLSDTAPLSDAFPLNN